MQEEQCPRLRSDRPKRKMAVEVENGNEWKVGEGTA